MYLPLPYIHIFTQIRYRQYLQIVSAATTINQPTNQPTNINQTSPLPPLQNPPCTQLRLRYDYEGHDLRILNGILIHK